MRLDADLPQNYGRALQRQAPLTSEGIVSDRVRAGLENALFLYQSLAKDYARLKEDNPRNFEIDSVSLVGSAARENKIDSDLDLLLLAPSITEQQGNDLKRVISYVLFCDRPKPEAVDVFIRPFEKYSDRANLDITEQVQDLIEKYRIVKE